MTVSMFDEYVVLPTPAIPPFRDLPEDHGELRRRLTELYLSEDSVRRVAHAIWERDGRQDGERPAEAYGWKLWGVKLRDAHWWQAKMMLDVVLDTDLMTVRLLQGEWILAGRPEGGIT